MRQTKALKLSLRKIYKQKRLQDGKEIGRKINDFTQALHLQFRLNPEKRDKDVIKTSMENLVSLRKEYRFRDNFPNFKHFYDYITDPKNGFTLEDIKEL